LRIDWEVAFIAAAMVALVRLLPVLDGRSSLAARYRSERAAEGDAFRLVWGRVRGVGVWASVNATTAGLGIRVLWLPWHPPVFIPWSEMVYCVPAGPFSGSARILCRHAESVPIHLVGRAGRAAVAEWVRHRSRC